MGLDARIRLPAHRKLFRPSPCVTIFEEFNAAVDRAFQRALNSEKKLSPAMTLLLYSVAFNGFELFPPKKKHDDPPRSHPDELAK